MSHALKNGSPLVFTYHHNTLSAYFPIAVAILDSGLTCSASLPCPAEMGASIHINGTGSSIIDTIFVCRHTGRIPRRWIVENADDLKPIVSEDLDKLQHGGVALTKGDIRCIFFGHLIRSAIWYLRKQWDRTASTDKKMHIVKTWISNFRGEATLEEYIDTSLKGIPRLRTRMIRESASHYDEEYAEVSF
jgi:hypothetical protein